jgi:hypothetical protein
MNKPIPFKRAIDMMRLGSRLLKMHTHSSPEGFAHYVVPGGNVTLITADKIKNHPLVHAGMDGLFPGHSQTWKI